MNKKLIVANWKMQLSYHEACSWIEQHLEELATHCINHTLVICPSFLVLPFAVALYPHFSWGAQTCGSELQGAFTGDISPYSLQELGVTYCLVGHSEQRQFHNETDTSVAKKATLLAQLGIIPIVCIGETAEEKTHKKRDSSQTTYPN